MLYTRKGDGGDSGLFGTKDRLPKDHLIYEALGSLDELNSLLGMCAARAKKGKAPLPVYDWLVSVQEVLFIIQAELAGADKRAEEKHVKFLEDCIAKVEEIIEPPKSFLIPGASELSAHLDYARAVSRRTERTVVRAQQDKKLSKDTLAFLNRLSSFLYALARFSAQSSGVKEKPPSY